MTVKPKLLIIYGSQTGQSKSIAENVASQAEERNYSTELLSLDESLETMPWNNILSLIVITSSTGDGDPPDNAIKFWRKLRSKQFNDQYLSHIRFALLGLGDTNYTTFCGFPSNVDKQLLKLGAKKIYKTACADDAVGLELTVDPWIENLWPALLEQKIYTDDAISPALVEPKKEPQINEKVDTPVVSDRQNQQEEVVSELSNEVRSSLMRSTTLHDGELKIPLLSEAFLEITYHPEMDIDTSKIPFQNGCPIPSADSPVFDAKVHSIKQLTTDKAVKTALEVTFNLEDHVMDYQPGDSIGVLCSNPDHEVESLLKRLGLLEQIEVPYHLDVKDELKHLKTGSRPKYQIPPHIPPRATLRHTLTHCCEIRSVPRKGLLRILAHYTTSEEEKRRLLELCSMQGSDEFAQFLRQPNVNVMDLLDAFPSCHPPIQRLLEHWPRLLPRPYSISSSPLKDPRKATFVFNVIEFPLRDGRSYERKGIATGWMQKLSQPFLNKSSDMDLSDSMAQLNVKDITIPIFLRTNTAFRLPNNPETPMILIGPGTGVAPFIGFLQQREEMVKANPELNFGPIWLLFGCRTKANEYLYREELERLHSAGILTRLLVCFSRENIAPQPRYVQDLIVQHQSSLIKLIVSKSANVYVCGDASNMAKDVMNALTQAIQNVQNMGEDEAKKYVLELQKEKRYLQDIWT